MHQVRSFDKKLNSTLSLPNQAPIVRTGQHYSLDKSEYPAQSKNFVCCFWRDFCADQWIIYFYYCSSSPSRVQEFTLAMGFPILSGIQIQSWFRFPKWVPEIPMHWISDFRGNVKFVRFRFPDDLNWVQVLLSMDTSSTVTRFITRTILIGPLSDSYFAIRNIKIEPLKWFHWFQSG